MNKEEARIAVERSLAKESATPTLGTNDRDAYIAERANELRAALIEPVSARVAREMFEYGTKEELKRTGLFAIAHRGKDWLIYSPELDVFSLAYGSDPDELCILGFASNDALAEWLG